VLATISRHDRGVGPRAAEARAFFGTLRRLARRGLAHQGLARHALLRIAIAIAVVIAIAASPAAWAGEYFEKGGVAIRGYDPVAYFTLGKPVKGSAAHRLEHQGSTFLFASAANRDTFARDPGKYAPQYGGYCAFGVAGGYKAATDPAAFSIVNGKLYLNYNRDVQAQWGSDAAGFIRKADRAWPAASRQAKVVE
jgi:YHS domain-containing protein